MFTANTFIKPTGRIARSAVPIGSVYRYVEGNGTYYASLGRHTDSEYYISMRISHYGSNVASITATPSDSATVTRACEVKGYFNFVLAYDDVPNVCALRPDMALRFGDVMSLPRDLDEDGNSHVYISLGANISETLREVLAIRVTGERTEFKVIPFGTLVAVRGKASLHIEREEE